MKVIHLPFFSSDAMLRDALRAMKWQQKSAVVRGAGGDFVLLKAVEIFRGLNRQVPVLNQLPSNLLVHKLLPHEITQWGLDDKNPDNTESSYNRFFASIVENYVLVDSVIGTALVVTRHEHQADEIGNSPKDCYCLGPGEHEFPPTSRTAAGLCGVCFSDVHCEY